MLADMLLLILFIGLNIASAFNVPLQHSRSHSRSYTFITEEINDSRLQYKDDRDIDTDKNVSITKIKESVHPPSPSFSRVTKSTAIHNLVTIDNLDDFRDYMNSNEDKVLVVRFFASWCQVSNIFSFLCFLFCDLLEQYEDSFSCLSLYSFPHKYLFTPFQFWKTSYRTAKEQSRPSIVL